MRPLAYGNNEGLLPDKSRVWHNQNLFRVTLSDAVTVPQLHDGIVKLIAMESTKGAWYRNWRLISVDGSTMDTADEKGNEKAFGRPSTNRGKSACPKARFVSLVENGTYVLFGTRLEGADTVEVTLAKGMLCLADRSFFGLELWA